MTAFSEFVRCLKQNILLTILTILLIVCCILFLCYVLHYYDVDSGTVQIRENEMFMENTLFRFGKADNSLFSVEVDGQKYGRDPFLSGKTKEELYEYAFVLDDMMNDIRQAGFLDFYFGNTNIAIPYADVNYEPDVLRGYAEQGERAIDMWPQRYKDVGFIVVEAAKVDINFINNSNLILSEGRLISEEDLSAWKEGDPVPVIMGHKFSEYYEIGDIIETYKSIYEPDSVIRGDGSPLVVVGFLEKDTLVFNSFVSSGTNMLENLDYTVLLPLLDLGVRDFEADKVLEIAIVGADTNDRIFYNTAFYFDRDKLEYGREKLTEILNDHGFGGYYIVQNSDYNVELTESITRERVTGLSVMTALVSIFTFFAIVITQLNKYNQNKKVYAIYILTGYTIKDIVFMSIVDMSLLFGMSLVLSHIPLFVLLIPDRFGGTRLYGIINSVYDPSLYVFLLILGLVLVTICAALCYFTVRKTDIVSLVKGGE